MRPKVVAAQAPKTAARASASHDDGHERPSPEERRDHEAIAEHEETPEGG